MGINGVLNTIFGRNKEAAKAEAARQKAMEALGKQLGTPPFGTPHIPNDFEDVPDIPMPPPTPDPPPPSASFRPIQTVRMTATLDIPSHLKLGVIDGKTLKAVVLKDNPPDILVRVCKTQQNGAIVHEVFVRLSESIREWAATGKAQGNEMEFAQRFICTEGEIDLHIIVKWARIINKTRDTEEFSREWYEAQRAKGNDNEEI